MPKSSTHQEQTSGKYSYEETAWILNWNDYCLINGLDFQPTISKTLKEELGKVRSWRQISDKLRSILRSFSKRGHSLKIDNVLKEGTRHFQVDWYEEELLKQANSGRDKLGIPRLGEEYIINSKYRGTSTGARPVSGSFDLRDYANVQKACRFYQKRSQCPQGSRWISAIKCSCNRRYESSRKFG
jgi:hypothetical protein